MQSQKRGLMFINDTILITLSANNADIYLAYLKFYRRIEIENLAYKYNLKLHLFTADSAFSL